MSANQPHIIKSLLKVLKPLIRILLKHGVSYAEFADLSRRIFVDIADNEFALTGRKQTIARIAVLTGINRKDVKRIREEPLVAADHPSKHNRAARVVTGWMQDHEFKNEDGSPKALTVGDHQSSFYQLIRHYSGDMPARAILDELIRVGSVNYNSQNQIVTLLQPSYVPRNSQISMLDVGLQAIGDQLDTIDHNLNTDWDDSRLQLSVVYDTISDASKRDLKPIVSEKAMEMVQNLDSLMLQFADQNISDACMPLKKPSSRVGIGIYYFDTREENT